MMMPLYYDLEKLPSCTKVTEALEPTNTSTRLWTWLESYLAPVLFIALSDGIWEVSHNQPLSTAAHGSGALARPGHSCLEIVTSNLLSMAHPFVRPTWTAQPLRYDVPREQLDRYLHLLKSIETRSTTRSSDEPIILATALGLGVARIIAVEGNARMATFFDTLRLIPIFWLFLGLPLLTAPGLTWAMATLRLKYALIISPHLVQPKTFCMRSRNGLLGRFSVILLRHSVTGWFANNKTKPHCVSAAADEEGVLGGNRVRGILSGCALRTPGRAAIYDSAMASSDTVFDVMIFQCDVRTDWSYRNFHILLAKIVECTSDADGASKVTKCEVSGLARLIADHDRPSLEWGRGVVSIGRYVPCKSLEIIGSTSLWQYVCNQGWEP